MQLPDKNVRPIEFVETAAFIPAHRAEQHFRKIKYVQVKKTAKSGLSLQTR
jgi:hypothetical protein